MNLNFFINISYIVSAILFGVGLKMLSSPDSARKGNFVSAVGMLLAIIGTLLTKGLSYPWIILGLLIGTIIGAISAQIVPMTAMPEMVALFNGFGGLASLLVAWAVYHSTPQSDLLTTLTIFLSILIGGVTFTGSVVAWAKLNETIPGKPLLYRGQQIINMTLLSGVLLSGIIYTINPMANYPIFIGIVILSLILGILTVIPIGGADMPVVISLLNSYSGLAACATGFVIKNNMLIVAGSLVGASGIILTQIMCKAMNRSLNNVLFSGFGAPKLLTQTSVKGEIKPVSTSDAYLILEAARFVVITPGYGMAVAQAQHVVRELGQLLMDNGAEVRYAIHPVAGRMPGHMNVLLSEADVPYDQLFTMDDINPVMEKVDVCIIIGANDVVNPAALHDSGSPIYGMPIIEAFRAKTVFVLKRSLATGFAGISNELFYYDNTRMLFGDAKASLQALVAEFKQAS
jgi:H+-translocating NAD(P) transhydrogenase subunit beta